MDTVSLANPFLIAMPAMVDPNFSRTLTYICEHNAEGAIGIIVNLSLIHISSASNGSACGCSTCLLYTSRCV